MFTDILFVLGLILLNGLFAMSEIAIVSSRRARLVQMVDKGRSGARHALALAAEPTRFLSSVQVGITSIGILSGAIGEATLAGHVRGFLERVPQLAPYAPSLSLTLTVVGLTYVSLIVGELVPKRIGQSNPEAIASLIARPMQVLARIGRPIVYVLSVSTDTVLRLLRVRRTKRPAITLEEMKVLLAQGTEEGVFEPTERDLVTNVLHLDDRHVGAVLTSRSDVVFLDMRRSIERNREILRRQPHTVLPLCDGGLDHVLGFVRSKRMVEQLLGGHALDLPSLAEPPLFVPETMSLMKLLEQLKVAKLTVALVVDEFGDVEGIVSLDDVVTAIVGEMPDGRDADEPMIVQRDDGSWLVDGAIDLDAVVRVLGSSALLGDDRQHYHTLGGLAMQALARVPKIGDVFLRGGFRVEVVDMDGNRVDRVLVSRVGTEGEIGE
jgi:putative hemolysin